MLHPAANRHPKATHQWLLMGVQACRLPALKPLKPLKTLKTLKTLTTRHGGPSLPFARPETLTLKNLKTLQTVQKLLGTLNRAGNSAAPRPHRLNIPLACFILQPTGTPRPSQNVFKKAFPGNEARPPTYQIRKKTKTGNVCLTACWASFSTETQQHRSTCHFFRMPSQDWNMTYLYVFAKRPSNHN